MPPKNAAQIYCFVSEDDPEKRHKSRVHLSLEMHKRRRCLQVYKHGQPASTLESSSVKWPEPPLKAGIGSAYLATNFPIALTAQEQCLVYHYTVVIPDLFKARWNYYGIITPAVDLFQLYSRYEVSFRAMLYDAATHRSVLFRKPAPLEYENHVIRGLISTIQKPTIGAILATAVLCNIKCLMGSGSQEHWIALNKMVAMHGGLVSFSNDQLLFTKLIWTFIALPGPLTGFDLDVDVGSSYHHLQSLVRSRQKVVVEVLPTSGIDLDHRSDSRRMKAFRTPNLRRLLQGNSLESSTERNCRRSILLFLASTMQFYGDFSSATEVYIERLYQKVQQQGDDLALSPAHLLWSLIRLSSAPCMNNKCTEIWVEVVQMLAVFNQLRSNQKNFIERVLFSSLEFPDQIEKVEEIWNFKQQPASDMNLDEPKSDECCVSPDCFCELLWFTASST